MIVSDVRNAAVARCRIGQEQPAIVASQSRGDTLPNKANDLVDWTEIDQLPGGTGAAAKGERGCLPLALLRALLPATCHDLSDMSLAEALDDRTSFCRFGVHEFAPEHAAFVRVRRVLLRLGLD